ncbi:MAG TPA: hypothetical protein VK997_12390 [Deferrisomatales bacterium]|nr:hypothetical protein [Deferrisomatales bacterium]
MELILFALALVWVVAGAGLVLRTAATRRFYQDMVPADKVRRYAIPAMLVGAVLLIGAFTSQRYFWWPLVLGGIAVAKGVYLLKADATQVQALLHYWCEEASEDTLRLAGLVIYSLGAALLGLLF